MCPKCRSGKSGNISPGSAGSFKCPYCSFLYSGISVKMDSLSSLKIKWIPSDDRLMHYETCYCPSCNGLSFHQHKHNYNYEPEAQIFDEEGYCRICSGWNKQDVTDLTQLLTDLSSPDIRLRGLAALRLGSLKKTEAVEPLIGALADESEFVRNNAVISLGEIMDISAVEPLITTLENPDLITKLWAVKVLGKLNDKRAVKPLIRFIKTDIKEDPAEDEIVRKAIKVLAGIGDPEVIPAFGEFLENINREAPRVRNGFFGIDPRKEDYSFDLIDGLEKLGATEQLYLLFPKIHHKNRALAAIGNIGDKKAIPFLINLISQQDLDNNLIKDAVNILGVWGDKQAVQPVLSLLTRVLCSISSKQSIISELYKSENTIHQIRELETKKNSDLKLLESVINCLGKLPDLQAVLPLIELLVQKNLDETTKKSAIIALGELGDKRALQPLIDLLSQTHLDKSVRQFAIAALGQLGDKCAIQPLIDLLSQQYSDSSLLQSVIDALGVLGAFEEKRVVQSFIDLLSQQNLNNSLKQSVIEALGKSGDELAVQPLIKQALNYNTQPVLSEAFRALIKILNLQEDFQPFIDKSSSKDSIGIRQNTMELLVELGDERAIQPLIEMILDYLNAELMPEAVRSLVKILNRQKEFQPLIDKMAQKDAFHNRISAIELLAEIQDKRAVQPLLNLLSQKDLDPGTQRSAIDTLGALGDKQAIRPLIDLLSQSVSDSSIRRSLINALGNFGNKQAVQPILDVLVKGSLDSSDQKSAVKVLGKLGDKRAVLPLIKIILNPEFGSILPETVKSLAEILNRQEEFRSLINKMSQENTSDVQRKFAIRFLAETGDEQAVQSLVNFIQKSTSDTKTLAYAIDALGSLRDERALLPLVRRMLCEDDEQILTALSEAVKSLSEILQRQEQFRPLIDNLTQKNASGIRISAMKLLVESHDDMAVKPLTDILVKSDTDLIVKEYAINSLGELGNKSAVGPLIHALSKKESPENVRGSAASALGRLGDKSAIKPLIESIVNDNGSVVLKAAEALVKIMNREKEFQPLIDGMAQKDPAGIRISAVKLLGELKDKQAVQPLIRIILSDPNPSVMLEATQSLARILNRQEEFQHFSFFKILSDNQFRCEIVDLLLKLNLVEPLIDVLSGSDIDFIAKQHGINELRKMGIWV